MAVLTLFSLSLIAHPNGWKQFPYLTCPQWHALKLCFFLGFPALGYPKQSLLIVGRNSLQIFGPSFVKLYTFHIFIQQLIILSQTVQSKDSIAISRMRSAHAPLRRLGPRSYLLFSSASVHSQGKTLWMLLLFPCPGTIPASSCLSSCQTSCCVPPLSGCAAATLCSLSPAPTTAPKPSCSVDPTPSPSESGHGTRSSMPAASRPAWQQTPHLAACDAAVDCRVSAQAVPSPPSGSRLQTRWFLHLLFVRCRQATVQEPFFRSLTGFLHALDWQCHPSLHSSEPAPSAVTASEIRPLTSPHAGQCQSSGGALWRPGYKPS